MDEWKTLADEMQGYIQALQIRVTELTQELAAELEKNPGARTSLRIARIHMRNMQVSLSGGKRSDAQKAEQ